ncbi:hypothetical protein [Cupriavidus nantongensis]|nr:hypothetical protein [Cupriavidus nantongensis]
MEFRTTTGQLTTGRGWTRHDTLWVLGIYGNAVGGGTLFWPVSLGMTGFWPMIILSVLALPVTFFPYLALGRFVLSGTTRGGRDGNILDATQEHLGDGWSKALTALYISAVFPGMTIYTITLTNTIIDFACTQLHLGGMSRWYVAPISTFVLMMMVRYGTTTVVRIMGYIVLPFILCLILFGIMAAPHWNASMLETATHFGGVSGLATETWKGLPLVVFAFSFTSIVSSFVVAQRRTYGAEAPYKVKQVMLVAVMLAVSTVLFFSWSTIFALSPAELSEAKASNLTILSFLARKFDTPAMAIASQAIVFAAVIKSFLAHYLATEESAKSFSRSLFGTSEATLRSPAFTRLIALFVYAVTTACAIANLDVLNLIKVALVPVSVFVVYFLPLYAFRKVPSLHRYQGRPMNLLIAAVGIVCLVSGIGTMIAKFSH